MFAAGCLAVIVATGTFQAWRQVGTLGTLRSTDYGRLLIVKVILFAGMVVLASFSREIVVHLFPGPRLGSRRAVPVVAGGADDFVSGIDPATQRTVGRCGRCDGRCGWRSPSGSRSWS